MTKENIKLRKCPHLFRCAFAVFNDIDGLTPTDFNKVHKILNTNQYCEYGPCLNLEISDSFWFYQSPDYSTDSFSYFKNYAGNKSKYADLILSLAQSGYIDCLHSWYIPVKVATHSG